QPAAWIQPPALRPGDAAQKLARFLALHLTDRFRRQRIRQKARAGSRPVIQPPCVRRIDTKVSDVVSAWHGGGDRCIETAPSLRRHLRPAFPTTVPPPVVMMQPQ